MHEQDKDKQSYQGEKVSPLWSNSQTSFYRHYKGELYLFLAHGTLEHNLEPMIMYRRIQDTTIWIRPLSEFRGEVTHNGKTMKRFEPYNGEVK